jgi:hypothetical protein
MRMFSESQQNLLPADSVIEQEQSSQEPFLNDILERAETYFHKDHYEIDISEDGLRRSFYLAEGIYPASDLGRLPFLEFRLDENENVKTLVFSLEEENGASVWHAKIGKDREIEYKRSLTFGSGKVSVRQTEDAAKQFIYELAQDRPLFDDYQEAQSPNWPRAPLNIQAALDVRTMEDDSKDISNNRAYKRALKVGTLITFVGVLGGCTIPTISGSATPSFSELFNQGTRILTYQEMETQYISGCFAQSDKLFQMVPRNTAEVDLENIPEELRHQVEEMKSLSKLLQTSNWRMRNGFWGNSHLYLGDLEVLMSMVDLGIPLEDNEFAECLMDGWGEEIPHTKEMDVNEIENILYERFGDFQHDEGVDVAININAIAQYLKFNNIPINLVPRYLSISNEPIDGIQGYDTLGYYSDSHLVDEDLLHLTSIDYFDDKYEFFNILDHELQHGVLNNYAEIKQYITKHVYSEIILNLLTSTYSNIQIFRDYNDFEFDGYWLLEYHSAGFEDIESGILRSIIYEGPTEEGRMMTYDDVLSIGKEIGFTPSVSYDDRIRNIMWSEGNESLLGEMDSLVLYERFTSGESLTELEQEYLSLYISSYLTEMFHYSLNYALENDIENPLSNTSLPGDFTAIALHSRIGKATSLNFNDVYTPFFYQDKNLSEVFSKIAEFEKISTDESMVEAYLINWGEEELLIIDNPQKEGNVFIVRASNLREDGYISEYPTGIGFVHFHYNGIEYKFAIYNGMISGEPEVEAIQTEIGRIQEYEVFPETFPSTSIAVENSKGELEWREGDIAMVRIGETIEYFTAADVEAVSEGLALQFRQIGRTLILGNYADPIREFGEWNNEIQITSFQDGSILRIAYMDYTGSINSAEIQLVDGIDNERVQELAGFIENPTVEFDLENTQENGVYQAVLVAIVDDGDKEFRYPVKEYSNISE